MVWSRLMLLSYHANDTPTDGKGIGPELNRFGNLVSMEFLNK